MSKLNALIRLARIKHWIKNGFVLAPLVFAGKVGNPSDALAAAAAFLAFGLAASAGYAFNDIWDADTDRLHPRKKNRPVASGALSKAEAGAFAAALAAAGLVIGAIVSYPFLAVLALYMLVNLFYSQRGKNMRIVDAFCIAIGFVLRVIGGADAIHVEATGWIVVTTFFLSLFLGFGKRRGEMLNLEHRGAGHRQVLGKYDPDLLDQIIVSTGTIAIISYALYTLDAGVAAKFGTNKLFYTIPFVAYGVFRYIHLLRKSKDADPTEVVTSDTGIILTLAGWLVTAIGIVYFGGGHFR